MLTLTKYPRIKNTPSPMKAAEPIAVDSDATEVAKIVPAAIVVLPYTTLSLAKNDSLSGN